MDASTGQVAAQKCRTARSRRLLIRLGILSTAFAAAVLAGTAAAQADEQDAAPEVVQGESEAIAQLPADMPPPEDVPAADDAEPGPVATPEPSPPKQPSPTDLTDLLGTVAVTEIVAETAELVDEVPAAGVSAPVVGAVAHAVRGVAATSDRVLGGAEPGGSDLVANALHVVSQGVAPGGLPEDDAGTEAPAPQAPAPQAPALQSSGESFVLPAVDGFERDRQLVAPLPSKMSRPAAARTSAAGSGVGDRRSPSKAAAPVEAPAAISSDLGGGTPLSELLGGDHGVASGGGAGAAADRATPGSIWYGDRAGLVSDPVRTDCRPHSEPVARPGFAPD